MSFTGECGECCGPWKYVGMLKGRVHIMEEMGCHSVLHRSCCNP